MAVVNYSRVIFTRLRLISPTLTFLFSEESYFTNVNCFMKAGFGIIVGKN